jgi:hypothetical protein
MWRRCCSVVAVDESCQVFDVSCSRVVAGFNERFHTLSLCLSRRPNDPTVPLSWPQYNTTADMNINFKLPMDTSSGLMSSYCDFWDGIVAELEAAN